MRIRTGIAAIALTAGAAVGSFAMTAPAMANPQNGLVNVYAENILSGNQIILLQNVPIGVAANVCGLTTNVLSNELLSGNHAVCAAKNSSSTKSWVSYS